MSEMLHVTDVEGETCHRCCAYAQASESGEALLFKGDDFGKTDISGAAY
jgi:uncharacterized protein with PIN domain